MLQMGKCSDGDLSVLGRCVDTGRTLVEADVLADLLATVHHPPDPDTVGRPPTRREAADLDDAAERLFLQLTPEEQALYLSAVSADEAASDLKRLAPVRREILLKLLATEPGRHPLGRR